MRAASPAASQGFVRYFPDKNVKPVDPACLSAYRWLTTMPVPRMLCEAIGMWKAVATQATTTTALIPDAEVAAALHGSRVPSYDAVPRAGLVLAVLARRARKTVPDTPQCALNWVGFGTEAGQPRLGDVICSLAETGAGVGLYVGEDDSAYHVLGATDDDRIGVARVAKTALYAVRRPLYEGVQFAANGIRLSRDGTPA